MDWRITVSCSLALLLVARMPAYADGPGPLAAPPPATAPAPALAPPPAPPARTARYVGIGFVLVGGVLAVASVLLLVRGYQQRYNPNPDEGIADNAYGTIGALISLPFLAVGGALLLPSDGSSTTSPGHAPLAQLPRGLALRFTF